MSRTHRIFASDGWRLIGLLILVLAVFDQSYTGRTELVKSQRRGCERGILDRQDTIRVRTVQARSDAAIGRDPRQPARTRRVRLRQAAVEWQSVRSLRSRIPPVLDCARVFPTPNPLPHFG